MGDTKDAKCLITFTTGEGKEEISLTVFSLGNTILTSHLYLLMF